MRTILAGMAAATTLAMVACSGQATPETDQDPFAMAETEQDNEQEQGPVVADPVDWDNLVTVAGIGGDLNLGPAGVRHVSTQEISSPTDHDHPSREMFVVVRFTVSTDAGSVTVPHGWGWRQGGQEYGPGDGGNAGTAPWMGAIPEVHSEAVVMGDEEPAVGYITFDLAEEGGELAFTDADGAMVRWTAPDQDQGQMPELEEWLSNQ